MKHEKTFAAINKLKDVELELHRLKNALEMANRAQPAQEPVAWSWVPSEDWGTYFTEDASKVAVMRERGLEVRPLYTTPQQRPWVGLTQEEVGEVEQFHNWKDCTWSTNELVRYVEATLRSKNT